MDDNNRIASPSASENEDHNYIDFLTLAFEMESEKDILNCMDCNIINVRRAPLLICSLCFGVILENPAFQNHTLRCSVTPRETNYTKRTCNDVKQKLHDATKDQLACRFRLSGLQVQQLTDADVPNQRTGIPHTNNVINIDTIDDDVVKVNPPDAVLLEAQLRWIHQEGLILGMEYAASLTAVSSGVLATTVCTKTITDYMTTN
ncbi:hypothetical protein DAPPUDRAFT_332532 [Daphnia pulex]|uniref:Uncharacterized protein n=1 Tax=Daphnia pulex TaxID=6669 RepID=E9HQ84_DAPPU|nr:hypothetical protein DAPPUDRAFT_332532 [Daphnia pulex]|eukprot:EFX66101.1 hypothetical protein DAPPUDRAFT_332532 [Daphnia pulex]